MSWSSARGWVAAAASTTPPAWMRRRPQSTKPSRAACAISGRAQAVCWSTTQSVRARPEARPLPVGPAVPGAVRPLSDPSDGNISPTDGGRREGGATILLPGAAAHQKHPVRLAVALPGGTGGIRGDNLDVRVYTTTQERPIDHFRPIAVSSSPKPSSSIEVIRTRCCGRVPPIGSAGSADGATWLIVHTRSRQRTT